MKVTYARFLASGICLLGVAWGQLSNQPDCYRFAVIGDTGTGGRAQYEVGERLSALQHKLRFESVLMLGDNLYGSQGPRDFRTKFELPYAKLLDAGVKFYAVLGNHDQPSQETYKPFNMGGKTYYSFRPEGPVPILFLGLDSNRLDHTQLAWLEKELSQSKEQWKIVYFHHPVYSSGARHGSDVVLRQALEPLFVKYGVAVVLAGHDHFYERLKPQSGVHYFVSGGAAKLRAGNARRTEISAKAFDRDNSFLVMEVNRNTLSFQAFSRTGETVDAGFISCPGLPKSNPAAVADEGPRQE